MAEAVTVPARIKAARRSNSPQCRGVRDADAAAEQGLDRGIDHDAGQQVETAVLDVAQPPREPGTIRVERRKTGSVAPPMLVYCSAGRGRVGE